MTEWSGTTGTHWGLIGERFALLIDCVLAPETLQRLTEAQGVEEAIDALVVDGIEQLPGFCLVGFTESRVTAYLRGGFSLRVEASWHDALSETGQDVRTWREVSVDGVSRFAMFGPADWHRAEVPIRSLDGGRERLVQGVQGLSLMVCEQLTNEEVPLMTTTQGTTTRIPVVRPRDTAQTTEFPEGIFGDLFGDTELSTNPVTIDGAEPTGGATETTKLAAPHGVIVLPGGDEVPVHGTLLLGRNPRDTKEIGAELVAVFDPNGNISRTHARIALTESGGVTIEDLGSTNGTVVVTTTNEILLTADTPQRLSFGDRIILGGDAQLEYRERS